MMTTLTTLPTDTFVTAAFAELLEDVTNLLSAAQAQKPLDKAEIGFWRRQLHALNKAESYWLQGVRPVISGSAYLVSSASRPGALIHRLTRVGGIVVCSCEAGQKQQLCWHHMLINVLERAAELESLAALSEAEIDRGPDTTPAAARALLATRLRETAQIIDAMRHAQGRAPLSCDPPNEGPSLGDDEGDTLPSRTPWYARATAARQIYLEAA